MDLDLNKLTSQKGNQRTLDLVENFVDNKITKEELIKGIDDFTNETYAWGYEQCVEDRMQKDEEDKAFQLGQEARDFDNLLCFPSPLTKNPYTPENGYVKDNCLFYRLWQKGYDS